MSTNLRIIKAILPDKFALTWGVLKNPSAWMNLSNNLDLRHLRQ